MAFWLAVSVVGFFMTDCRKTLAKTKFYRVGSNRSQLQAYVSPEDYSRGMLMTAIQAFIYSLPMLALGLLTQFEDNGLKFFWGMTLILAAIYGNIGSWYQSKSWKVATWRQFLCTCWIPLPMLMAILLWLMVFDVKVNNEIVIIFANMVSSGLSVMAIMYFRNGMKEV